MVATFSGLVASTEGQQLVGLASSQLVPASSIAVGTLEVALAPFATLAVGIVVASAKRLATAERPVVLAARRIAVAGRIDRTADRLECRTYLLSF